MFDVKHTISLWTGEQVLLYGEDYFADKRVFWESHQTQLLRFWDKAKQYGPPIEVEVMASSEKLQFSDLSSFKQWLMANHPFEAQMGE